MYFSDQPPLCSVIFPLIMRMPAFPSASVLKHFRLARIAVMSALLALASISHASDPVVAGEVLVKLQSAAVLPSAIAVCPGTLSTQFGSRPIYRFKLAAGCSVDAVVTNLLGLSGVLLAEPNSTNQSPEARKLLPWAVGSPSAYATQWAPAAMRLSEAHLFTKGAGIKVAVLSVPE